jgi:glycosyltransferase involved in cell wall biosynthesis
MDLKIAVIIENQVSGGGGFNQAMNAFFQLERLVAQKYEIKVYTSIKDNIPIFKNLNTDPIFFKIGLIDKFIETIAKASPFRRIFQKFKIVSKFERQLMSDEIGIVYFVTPSRRPLILQHLNYITTVWDLSHRDTPEFPEIRNYHQIANRDEQFMEVLPPAYLILCDSEELVEIIHSRYGIDKARLLAMPYSHSPFLKIPERNAIEAVLKKYGIHENYFLYPAQFWPHKNHFRLLAAARLLKAEKKLNKKIVFVGRDMGNLAYIKEVTKEFSLNEEVINLGFIPSADLSAIYAACDCVVMPTYFGPTNIPPLEAWFYQKPLIYSKNCSCQAGDAAEIIDPDCELSIALAMEKMMDKKYCLGLIELGKTRLLEINSHRVRAEEILCDRIDIFFKRRKTWGSE